MINTIPLQNGNHRRAWAWREQYLIWWVESTVIVYRPNGKHIVWLSNVWPRDCSIFRKKQHRVCVKATD